ncbi:MAG: DUF433 domain-containing protein [Patescibacteria group bacterium]
MQTKLKNRIIIDPRVMVGKPIIKGTRITVELILRLLAQGQPVEEILDNYPHLKKEDIRAAIEYAAELLEREAVYPLTTTAYAKVKTVA